MSQHHANVSRRARRTATKNRRDAAFRKCMASIRGNFAPPLWALESLLPGDLIEYRAALAASKEKQP